MGIRPAGSRRPSERSALRPGADGARVRGARSSLALFLLPHSISSFRMKLVSSSQTKFRKGHFQWLRFFSGHFIILSFLTIKAVSSLLEERMPTATGFSEGSPCRGREGLHGRPAPTPQPQTVRGSDLQARGGGEPFLGTFIAKGNRGAGLELRRATVRTTDVLSPHKPRRAVRTVYCIDFSFIFYF